MSDEKNPFLEENFVQGGGLWDGRVVTFIRVRSGIDMFTKADGTAWINSDGKQGSQAVISVIGIANDSEQERKESYSMGTLIPTSDGLGFTKADGTPGQFGANSGAAKFAKAVKAAGFPIESLFVPGKGVDLSKLDGASFLMKGETKKDKDGNDKINKKGYAEQAFFPVKYEGSRVVGGGVGAPVASAPSQELKAKAVAVFTQMLTEAEDNKVSRRDSIVKISELLKGDPDANKIIILVTKPDFHKGQAWTADGTGYELIPF